MDPHGLSNSLGYTGFRVKHWSVLPYLTAVILAILSHGSVIKRKACTYLASLGLLAPAYVISLAICRCAGI